MTPRQARFGADIFTGLVVASIGVALAGVTWRLLGDPGRRFGASPVAARPSMPIDITPLIALAPFGGASAAASPTVATNQPLTLRGILLARPVGKSSALISVGDTAAVAFRIGQAVANSTIDSIAVDHVVLLSGGARTILAFPRDQRGGSASVTTADTSYSPSMGSSSSSSSSGGGSSMAGSSPSAAGSSSSPSARSSPATASSSGLSMPNSMAMLSSMGAVQSGSGLSVNTPNAAMLAAGLQAGDQIVAINGNSVSSVMGNPALLQSALAAGSARVDILRSGQTMSLVVPIR